MKASLALFALTLAANTQGPDYSGFIPATMTLHQKSEYYDKWEKKLPCASGRLSTRVTLSDLDPGPTYDAVSFSVNGHSAGAVKYNSPADTLQLIAVGSTAKLDENDLECDLTS